MAEGNQENIWQNSTEPQSEEEMSSVMPVDAEVVKQEYFENVKQEYLEDVKQEYQENVMQENQENVNKENVRVKQESVVVQGVRVDVQNKVGYSRMIKNTSQLMTRDERERVERRRRRSGELD